MKRMICLILIGLSSCSTSMDFINQNEVDKIEVDNGYAGDNVDLKTNIQSDLINDLNESVLRGPMKYIKTHRIFVFYKDNDVDTIWTNGQIHQININGKYKTFESSENLIKKYSR